MARAPLGALRLTLGVPLACPIHGDALRDAGSELLGECGTSFPVSDGIPVLLPRKEDRASVLSGDWNVRSEGAGALAFYNQTCDHHEFCRETLQEIRTDLLAWRAPIDAPALEIGSGRGALQGIGEPYVALDYSLTALKAHIEARYQRVCATAEALPFPDSTFGLVFTVASLEHVPMPDRAFEEIHRILRPGGIAYLAPAWHCIQDNCEGIPVRPYAELRFGQRLRKATLPWRQSLPAKTLTTLPLRIGRRVLWSLGGRHPTSLRFRTLKPDYARFWMSDSDAVARLDSHEACLFFESRGYEVLRPGSSPWAQLLARHQAVVVEKPPGGVSP